MPANILIHPLPMSMSKIIPKYCGSLSPTNVEDIFNWGEQKHVYLMFDRNLHNNHQESLRKSYMLISGMNVR